MRRLLCMSLNYIELSLIWLSPIPGCVLMSFALSFSISALGLEICVITAVIKKYKPAIKKMRKKHDKIILLAKYNLP